MIFEYVLYNLNGRYYSITTFYIIIFTHMDLNKVLLIGRATDTSEIKRIESNDSSVVNFVIATNRKFKNKDGNIQEEAEYHRCVAYGNSADVLGKYLHKWKRVYVEGRLRTRKWTDNAGLTKYSTEVIVTHFIFLDSKANGEDENIHMEDTHTMDTMIDEEVPF